MPHQARSAALLALALIGSVAALWIAGQPLMLGADASGREILHPVAITNLGGLVSAARSTRRLAAPASGRVTAVLQLTIDGNPAQARFAIAQ